MSGWVIVLSIAAVLIAIGMIPLGVDAQYRDMCLAVRVRVGPFGILVFPKEKRQLEAKKETTNEPKQKKKLPFAGDWDSFLALLQLLFDLLGELRRKIRAELIEVHLLTGGADAAKSAIAYGRAWALIGGVTPLLERLFVIRKRDICPVLDYTKTKMEFDARLVFTITVARLLALAVRAGLGYLRLQSKHEKGGANV